MDEKLINKELEKFGKNYFGLPNYRIVWSEKMTEKRYGTFRDFVGDIFLREFVGVREVKKYNYLKDRWILERWFPPENSYNPEIPESQWGYYEPIFVFQNDRSEYLEPNLRVCEFIVNRAEKPMHVTPEERIQEQLDKEEKERQFFEDFLEVSPITNALHLGEGVGYSGKAN